MEQEEIIEKQAAQIRDLLTELMQFRALSEEEARITSTIPGKEGTHLWK